MSITNIQTPEIISPVFNPLYYQVSSTNSSQNNFRYIFSLYDKDGIISTKNVFPFPNELGRIDVSYLVRDNVKYDRTYINNSIYSIKNSLKQYDLFIGEQSSSPITPVSSGIKYVLNGVFNPRKGETSFDFKKYIMNPNIGRFLTNTPTQIETYVDDYYTLNFLNGVFGTETSSVKYILFKKNNGEGGAYLNPDYNYNPQISLQSVDQQIKGVGVGPKQLNSTQYYEWTDGSLPSTALSPVKSNFITTDIDYYDVWGVNASMERTTEIIRFNILKDITKYPRTQLTFLNRLGGWSYFTFDHKTDEMTDIKRDVYTKYKYENLNETTFGTTPELRGDDVYNINVEKNYTLRSRFIDQQTFDFVEELITSPSVYVLNHDLGPIPVIVTDLQWFNLKKINNKEIRFDIKIKLSNKININI